MLLAPRALGLGATLTTLYLAVRDGSGGRTRIAPGVHSYALLPIGYHMGRLGQYAASRSLMSSMKI